MAHCKVWFKYNVFFSLLTLAICFYQVWVVYVFVCLHMVLPLQVNMCLSCLHMPAVCPRSVTKIDKDSMLFSYEYFTLLLVSHVPPTVSGFLALIWQRWGRHWRRYFRQPRSQEFISISHQELSIRYAIPPVFVTAAFIVRVSAADSHWQSGVAMILMSIESPTKYYY